MKHLFIINPSAGGQDRTRPISDVIHKEFLCRKEDEYEIYVTKAPLDAAEKVKAAARSGNPIRIYSCGGDGTFNECVNGAAGYDNVAVTPYPFGTGNDFCRMFGEEKDLFRDLNALLSGSIKKIDLIRINDRYCADICSAGIDARIGTNVHKYTSLPLCNNKSAYLLSVVAEVCKGISSNMTVKVGNYVHTGPTTLCCVCNGRYYGGGFNPAPSAMPDDGILDIFVAEKMNAVQLAANIGKYAAGKADEVPELIHHLRGTAVTIDFDRETVMNVDGEALVTKHADIAVVPSCLNLIVPKGITFFS